MAYTYKSLAVARATTTNIRRLAMDEGVAFLGKPFTSEQLLRKVRAVLTPGSST